MKMYTKNMVVMTRGCSMTYEVSALLVSPSVLQARCPY